MPAIFNHFWIILIIMSFVNAIIWKVKTKKYIEEKPERKKGYDQIIKVWLIFSNIPWLIIGIGMLTGITRNIFEFFKPNFSNPIITMFFITLTGFWITGTIWIYFKGGAQMLVDHPGIFTKTEKGNEKFELLKVKLLWALGTIGWIVGMTLAFNKDFPDFAQFGK